MDKPTVSSVQKHIETLISKSEQLIDADSANMPVALPGAVRWLRYMHELLSQGQFTHEDLADQSFAIFRVVTDDGYFEESDIGKELLELGGELKKLK